MNILTQLKPLQKHQDIQEAMLVFKKAETLSREQTPENADSLRGELLRFLDLLIKQQKAYTALPTWIASFFWQSQPIEALSKSQLAMLRKATINALNELAHAFPINDSDPISLENFSNEDIVFTSLTGKRYELNQLAQWLRTSKDFIYPDQNIRMVNEDIIALKDLFNKHRISYKPVSDAERQIRAMISKLGITDHELRQLQVPILRIEHLKTIQALMTEHGLEKVAAINELQHLNYEQADAIKALYAQGLRGEHLRQLPYPESEYLPHHTAALEDLLSKGYSIEVSIDAIAKYPGEQVQEVYFNLPNARR